MEAPPLALLVLALSLTLDLLAGAVRAAYQNASLARLLSTRDENTVPVNRVLNLLHSPHLLEASLNLTQLLARFFLAAMILLLVFSYPSTLSTQVWVSAGCLLLAALVIFLLEWLIELLVSRSPETWALRLAPFVRVLKATLTPLMIIPIFSTSRQAEQEAASTVTEDELKSMVDASHEGGVLEQDERQMIYSIFALGDTLAREIMVPRIYITALDVSISLAEAVQALLQSGHSRLPVYEETVDNILGLLYAKDLLRAWSEGGETASLRSLLRPAYFIPEAKKVDVLLEEMQAEHVQMALVVDEYGGIAGLVTMEDIVEEIVGDIQDEYDQSEELPYVQVGEGEYVFQGRIDLKDFNELLECQLPMDEAETLGGFIYSEMERVPSSGEGLIIDGVLLTVEQVSGRRIRKVRARKIQNDDTPVQGTVIKNEMEAKDVQDEN
jgi:CBS domain containing-hemolysin-like protein